MQFLAIIKYILSSPYQDLMQKICTRCFPKGNKSARWCWNIWTSITPSSSKISFLRVGEGHGSLQHLYWPQKDSCYSELAGQRFTTPFPPSYSITITTYYHHNFLYKFVNSKHKPCLVKMYLNATVPHMISSLCMKQWESLKIVSPVSQKCNFTSCSCLLMCKLINH